MNNNEQSSPIYIKSVLLENYGPCINVKYDFRFDENGNPIPLVLIGKNGSGKSIFLSHIVNTLITAKQLIYENCEVEKGKVYKLRSASYISSGSLYSKSKVEFTTNDAIVTEWILRQSKEILVKDHGFSIDDAEWNNIPDDEQTQFITTLTQTSARDLIDNACIQYFPSNRFEEPAWLNSNNLTEPVEYMNLKNIGGISNRSIVSLSTLKESQNWLLDILFDRNILELQTSPLSMPIQSPGKDNEPKTVDFPFLIMLGYKGQASLIYVEILKLLNELFDVPQGTLRFGVGDRRTRQLSIMKGEQAWIPNLFQLSSGEALLLDLFLCIIKDYDLSNSNFSVLSDINGIVLIDEIDLHLHVNLQKDILPRLINLFPKIQFVITTHSPVFLLGMQNTFGTNGFEIIEMPSAESINIESFTEFQDLFTTIRETETYIDSIKTALRESQLPAVFVEGEYDIKYLTKTIELFYKDNGILERFKFFDGDGFGNLDKIWKSMDSKVVDMLSVNVLLLYDCDISKADNTKGKVTRKTIPSSSDNIIKKGIENLFSEVTINKLQEANPQFIDVTEATKKVIRGVEEVVPELKEVNKNEKKNICDWLCSNGDDSDFKCFKIAIDIIIDYLDHVCQGDTPCPQTAPS